MRAGWPRRGTRQEGNSRPPPRIQPPPKRRGREHPRRSLLQDEGGYEGAKSVKAKPFTRLRHLGKSPTQVVLYGSLLLSLLWNGVLVTRFAAEHLTRKVIPNRHLNAVERGADY